MRLDWHDCGTIIVLLSFLRRKAEGHEPKYMIVNPMFFDVLGEPLSAQECHAKHECKALELVAKPLNN